MSQPRCDGAPGSLSTAWEGDKLSDNTCPPSTSQRTPHFLSFPFPGGRAGGQLSPPFLVTRETGAWAWGGARNLGVLPPSLQPRLCLQAPGEGASPEEEKVGQGQCGVGVWEGGSCGHFSTQGLPAPLWAPSRSGSARRPLPSSIVPKGLPA